MSVTTDRARATWRMMRGRWVDIPELDRCEERDFGARMEYVETPELRHELYLFRGILSDAAVAANALDVWHEGGHALERARRSSRLSADELDRFLLRRYGQAKADELRARDQSRWGNRPEEHYAEHFKAVALGIAPKVGTDLGDHICDLGVPLNRQDLEAFFAPKPVERRIAEFWDVVDQLPPDALLTAEDVGGWALNVVERDSGVRCMVRDFRTVARDLQSAFDRAGTPT